MAKRTSFNLMGRKIGFLFTLTLLVVLLLPLVIKDDYVLRILVMIFIYSIAVLGLNFIIGYSGLLAFGHSAFIGIGAYTTGLLMTELGVGFWPSLGASMLTTTVFGFLVGIPAVRIRGDYLVLVTMAFGEVFRLVMQGWQSLAHGQMGIVGIPAPTVFGHQILTNPQFYYLSLFFLLASLAILSILGNSKIGRAMIAIREDELAASTLGINAFYYKLINFVIGAFFAGIAGSIFAVYLTAVSPSNFTMGESVLMIIMVIVGGIGSLPGSIVGTALLLLATELFRPIYKFRLLIIGLILLAVLLWHPEGIMGNRTLHQAKAKKEGGL